MGCSASWPSHFRIIAASGLGVSGDTACADHVIVYRMRKLAGLGAVLAGEGPNNTDNILYSTGASPTGFEHPHCLPTDWSASMIENGHSTRASACAGPPH